ncbi:hypothetical protein EII25_06385 [Erysipelotrichaceae bacterium OH741_COT-311]|nr:hypothetical protein EII25_06385 [Erysipelotrichaceae bacterium OH741_COT-311]
MLNKSSYAISSKAKAMYGKRLKLEDYQALIAKKSIPEIASYLKKETYYQEVLDGINEGSIHRGKLEYLIRQDLFERFNRLLKYGLGDQHGTYRWFIVLTEVEQILESIRVIQSQDNFDMISRLPLFLEKSMSFDLKELINARSFQDLHKVIEHTPYNKLLSRYLFVEQENVDYVQCEHILKEYYYQTIFDILKENPDSASFKAMRDIFHLQMELENINKIYRLKKYFKTAPSQINKYMNKARYHINDKLLHKFIYDCNLEEFIEALKHTYYGKFIKKSGVDDIEWLSKQILYHNHRQNLLYSNDPDLVLIAYLALIEVEIQNIIDIIEGVRYKVPQDKIFKLLLI